MVRLRFNLLQRSRTIVPTLYEHVYFEIAAWKLAGERQRRGGHQNRPFAVSSERRNLRNFQTDGKSYKNNNKKQVDENKQKACRKKIKKNTPTNLNVTRSQAAHQNRPIWVTSFHRRDGARVKRPPPFWLSGPPPSPKSAFPSPSHLRSAYSDPSLDVP